MYLMHFAGFLVLGIDYFFGDPVYIHSDETGFDREAWMDKSKAQARKHEPEWFKAVQDRYGASLKFVSSSCFC